MRATPDWNDVVQRYGHHIFRMHKRYTGASDDLAQELTQETFTEAIAQQETFNAGAPMWPWLSTIAIRVSAKATRAARTNVQSDIGELEPSIITDSLGDPADMLIARQGRLLPRLSTRQRRLLVMKYLLRYSVNEIAELEQTSSVAIRKALERARRHLDKLSRAERFGIIILAMVRDLSARFSRRTQSGTAALSAGIEPVLAVTVITTAALFTGAVPAFRHELPPRPAATSVIEKESKTQLASAVNLPRTKRAAGPQFPIRSYAERRVRREASPPGASVRDETTIRCDAGVIGGTTCRVLAVVPPIP